MIPEVKPRRATYVLLLVFLVAAGIPSGSLLWDGIEGVRSPLKRMLGPGSEQIAFDRRGDWTVFYEYRSTIEGRPVTSSSTVPPLKIKLTSPSGVELLASSSSTPLTYRTTRASGVSVGSFTLDDPGLYTVGVEVTSAFPEGEIVVAFGHEKAQSVGRLISGAVLLGSTFLVAFIGMGIILFLRVRSKRRAERAASYEMPPPPPGH